MIVAEPTPLVRLVAAASLVWCLGVRKSSAQIDFERAPINYSQSQPDNCVTDLIEAIELGQIKLQHDSEHGYLKSLLKHMAVPEYSQTLVFSKTSHQKHRISPQTPRALYFNDNVYVGWVQGGTVIEISAADPHLGAVFYTIDQRKPQPDAKITRQLGRCTLCHASTHTGRIPGHIVRSIYPDKRGMPILAAGTFVTTDRSPLSQRWGGWYVTGNHGDQRHMGNVWAPSDEQWENLDFESGANVTDLSGRLSLEPYLTPHSDIVALMVMEHQIAMHNLFTKAHIEWRLSRQEESLHSEQAQPKDQASEESAARLNLIAQRVADGLLMKNQTVLTSDVRGTSPFQFEFERSGPFDSLGRGLRKLNLHRRLFHYRCSYMIHSKSFDGLEDELRTAVYQRVAAALTAASINDTKRGAENRATLEILKSTKEEFQRATQHPE